jgi:hypothetical protein
MVLLLRFVIPLVDRVRHHRRHRQDQPGTENSVSELQYVPEVAEFPPT